MSLSEAAIGKLLGYMTPNQVLIIGLLNSIQQEGSYMSGSKHIGNGVNTAIIKNGRELVTKMDKLNEIWQLGFTVESLNALKRRSTLYLDLQEKGLLVRDIKRILKEKEVELIYDQVNSLLVTKQATMEELAEACRRINGQNMTPEYQLLLRRLSKTHNTSKALKRFLGRAKQ